MSKIITAFNGRLLFKIGAFLRSREGFIVEEQEYTDTGARTTVQDSMGFRYEVTVKTLGRIQMEAACAE